MTNDSNQNPPRVRRATREHIVGIDQTAFEKQIEYVDRLTFIQLLRLQCKVEAALEKFGNPKYAGDFESNTGSIPIHDLPEPTTFSELEEIDLEELGVDIELD